MRRTAGALVPLALVWLAGTEGVTLAPWCAALTVVAAGLFAVVSLTHGVRLHRASLWLAALLAWACIDAAVAPVDHGEAAWLVAGGAVALALSVVAALPAGARAAGWAVFAAGTAVAPWLIVQRVALHVRPAGPFDDPNLGATLIVLAFAILPALRARPAWRGAAAALQLAGVLASGSRAGLLAVAVVAGCWALAGRSRRTVLLVGTTVAVALGGLVWRVASDRDPLRWERVRIWSAAAATAVAELPLGCGPAGFSDAVLPHNFPQEGAFARFGRIPGVAENDLLELAATLGLPGLVIAAGLALSVWRAAGGRSAAVGVLGALVTTSAFHTQLDVAIIAWIATLAVGATATRARGPRLRLSVPQTLAGAALLAAPAGLALGWPRTTLFPDPGRLLRAAEATVAEAATDDVALAKAEAAALEATRLRPRSPRGWLRLGDIRLRRALLRREVDLARAAGAAYEHAARVSPLDVWAALGAGRARAALGDATAARGWLQRATAIEPNSAAAWLELARLDLEAGRVAAARARFERAEHAVETAHRAGLDSGYERALAEVDPVLFARLRGALERP